MTRDEIYAVVQDVMRAQFAAYGTNGFRCATVADVIDVVSSVVSDRLAHLALSETERESLEDLRDSDCATEDEAALLTRIIGATP